MEIDEGDADGGISENSIVVDDDNNDDDDDVSDDSDVSNDSGDASNDSDGSDDSNGSDGGSNDSNNSNDRIDSDESDDSVLWRGLFQQQILLMTKDRSSTRYASTRYDFVRIRRMHRTLFMEHDVKYEIIQNIRVGNINTSIRG